MEAKLISNKAPKLAALAMLLIALACASLAGPAPAFADESSSSSTGLQSTKSASDDTSGLDESTAALIRQIESLSSGDYKNVSAELESLTASLPAYLEEVNAWFNDLVSALQIILAVLGFLGTLITALLAEWLFRRQTLGAAEMIRKRTGATIGSGVVGAIAIPLLALLLTCLAVTLPVAGGVTFGALSLSSVAAGFMGASLFKLAFKKMGRFKCALAGGAIVGVAGAIPYLGIFVSIIAFIYLLGYVLQSIYLGMKDPSPASDEAADAEAHLDDEPAADEGESETSEAEAGEAKTSQSKSEADEADEAKINEDEPEAGDPETSEPDTDEEKADQSEPEAAEAKAHKDEQEADGGEPETADEPESK